MLAHAFQDFADRTVRLFGGDAEHAGIRGHAGRRCPSAGESSDESSRTLDYRLKAFLGWSVRQSYCCERSNRTYSRNRQAGIAYRTAAGANVTISLRFPLKQRIRSASSAICRVSRRERKPLDSMPTLCIRRPLDGSKIGCIGKPRVPALDTRTVVPSQIVGHQKPPHRGIGKCCPCRRT